VRLVSFERDGARGIGALRGDDEVEVLDGFDDMVAWLEAGMPRAEGGERVPLAGVRLLAPVPRPASIRDCMSFEEHVIESTRSAGLKRLAGLDRRVERVLGPRRSLAHLLSRTFYRQPPYYKSNPRSVVGPEAEVRIPRYCEVFDYELEWAVVIGREGADIPAERAREHIAGYTVFNDFSARDAQLREMGGRLGPAKGKDFDTGNARPVARDARRARRPLRPHDGRARERRAVVARDDRLDDVDVRGPDRAHLAVGDALPGRRDRLGDRRRRLRARARRVPAARRRGRARGRGVGRAAEPRGGGGRGSAQRRLSAVDPAYGVELHPLAGSDPRLPARRARPGTP
jgi:hypothetical protein